MYNVHICVDRVSSGGDKAMDPPVLQLREERSLSCRLIHLGGLPSAYPSDGVPQRGPSPRHPSPPGTLPARRLVFAAVVVYLKYVGVIRPQ